MTFKAPGASNDAKQAGNAPSQVDAEAPGRFEPAGDPLAALAELAQPTVDDLVEILMAWAQSVFGSDEIVEAREQFFSLAGKVFHDDAFYETRINYFFDYFLFERPVTSSRVVAGLGPITPLALFLRRCDLGEIELPPEKAQLFGRLAGFRHSLFEVLKVKDQTMIVRDLWSKEKHQISSKSGETYRGFEKKDIFQAYLFVFDDQAYLSHGVVQHPVKAARIIKKQLKAGAKNPDFNLKPILSKLARQQLRFLRHRHVDPVLLYNADPR